MRIIFSEIKKIFNLKMVLFLIFMNIILYFLFVEFDITCFPNGRPENDIYRIILDMKNQYGTYMDENEFEDFMDRYNEDLNKADNYIKEHKEFKKLGVKNYEELMEKKEFRYEDKELRKKVDNAYSDIMFNKCLNLFWELEVKDDMIYEYQNKEKIVLNNIRNPNKNQKERLLEILDKKSECSVFHSLILRNYQSLIVKVAMIIILSVIFMISPVFLKDNKNKIVSLQYTSKRGRKTFKSKVIAGIIASLVIATVQLIGFFIIYSYNKVQMFYDCNINSVFGSGYFWCDITFLQYIIISVAAIYVLVLAFSVISMMISSMVKNNIALIGIKIPIAFLTFKLALRAAVTGVVSIIFKEGLLLQFIF